MRVIGVLAPQGTGDTEAPTVPSGLSVTVVNKSRIDLSWNASTDNVGVSGYQVFRDGGPLDTVTHPTTTYSDTTVEPSTTYSYTVAAFDGSGNTSAESGAEQGTTPANQPPTWSTIPDQELVIGNSFTLNLNDFADDVDEESIDYLIISGTLPDGLTLSDPTISGTPTTSGQSATITVRADDGTDTADTSFGIETFDADVTAPPTPTGLASSSQTASSITLSWNASTDAAGSANEFVSGTDSYRVYRDSGLVVDQSSTSFLDSGLSAETQYSYQVSAVDVAGNESALSSAVQVTTQAASDSDGLLTTLPTLSDERAAYDAQGMTRTLSDEQMSFSGVNDPAIWVAGWTSSTQIHGDTEGDDLWMAWNQYNRYNGVNQDEADDWLTRANNMRDWMVANLEDEVLNVDQNGDHLYGWGLAEKIRDEGPDAAGLAVLNAVRAGLSANTDVFANETPGVDSVFFQSNAGRRWGRWLRFSVALTEIDSQSANVTFRDKVIDLVLQDPAWNSTWGMYFLSEGTTDDDDRLGPGAYAAGARICILFQMGLVADGMWHAWRALTAEGDSRANLIAQRLVAMADFWLAISEDAGDRLHELNTGRNISSGDVIRANGSGTGRGNESGGNTDGIYRISPVNNLVFAYKLTGDERYLTEAWNLWKDWQTITGLATGVVDHFADTIHQNDTPVMANNKGELQYVYALFENGGNPIIVDGFVPSWYTAMTEKTWVAIGTAFNSFDPLVQFPNWDVGNTLAGADYLEAKIGNWNGAVTDGRTFIIPNTGGHRGSGFNAVYQFNFISEDPDWHWYGTDPTLYDIPTHTGTPDATISNWSAEENVGYYSDGLPSCAHTYDHLAYDAVNRVVFQPFSAFVYSGANQTSSIQDVATSVQMAEQGLGGFYEAQGTYPNFPSVVGPGGLVEWDSQREKVWIFATGAQGPGVNRSLLSLDIATKIYTVHATAMGSITNDSGGGAIDPERGIMIVRQPGDPLLVIDLTEGREGEFVEISAYTDPMGGDIGCDYEPVGKKFVGYEGGATLYTMEPPVNYRDGNGALNASATWVWQAVTNNGGGVTPSIANKNGTYGRFRYISALHAFAAINQHTDSMFVYKLPAGGL